jgi:hypothetical protein
LLLKRRARENPKTKGSKAKQELHRFPVFLTVEATGLLKAIFTESAASMTTIKIAARLKPFKEYCRDRITDMSVKKEKLSNELNAILPPKVLWENVKTLVSREFRHSPTT